MTDITYIRTVEGFAYLANDRPLLPPRRRLGSRPVKSASGRSLVEELRSTAARLRNAELDDLARMFHLLRHSLTHLKASRASGLSPAWASHWQGRDLPEAQERMRRMSWNPAIDPGCPDEVGLDAIETLIVPRARDLGGFEVRRALPAPKR